MTEGDSSADPLALRRRRALYRAWHRGTKEMDLIMGRFADAEIGSMNEQDLSAFEALIEAADPELFAWVVNGADVPPDYRTDVFSRLRAFHLG